MHGLSDVKIPANSPVPTKNIENPDNLKNKFKMFHKKPDKSIDEIMDLLGQINKEQAGMTAVEDAPTIKPPKRVAELLDRCSVFCKLANQV